jgi:hypothetical protein
VGRALAVRAHPWCTPAGMPLPFCRRQRIQMYYVSESLTWAERSSGVVGGTDSPRVDRVNEKYPPLNTRNWGVRKIR